GLIADVLLFEQGASLARADEIAAIRRAYFRAMEYARANPDEAYAIMGSGLGMDGKDFGLVLHDGIRLVDERGQGEYFAPGGLLDRSMNEIGEDLTEFGLVGGDAVGEAQAEADVLELP
ncbi:MAG: hypothetical protein ACOYN0_19245, partial [Phycisphaerales bacterium]